MSLPGEHLDPKSIAVAGGGLIGLSIAWRLAQQGFRVVLFEKGQIGGEASWAGAGMLAPGGEMDAPSRLATLAIESRDIYAAFVREIEDAAKLAIDYQEGGALELAYTPGEWTDLQAKAERQADLGIESKIVKESQLAAFWPRVNRRDLAGALFYPQDAIVNPRELVIALSAACRQLGVDLQQNCPIQSAAIAQDRVTVTTRRAEEVFRALVIAAGAWSGSIPVENVPPLPPSAPIKGHLIGYHQPDQTCNTIIRYGHTYLLQRANGLLIAGASVEHVGWNRSIEPAIAASLAKQAGFILPHLNETTPSEIWVGFRPGSDQLHLGRWHSSRLYLAYGHYRNGILLAPATAQNIAREITASLQTQ
ncbi:MAG: glycine oxidase ThiO [Acidobacteriota bacterium]|nr:glycine oxidase ThiO [Acidobacteriota bacterium]